MYGVYICMCVCVQCPCESVKNIVQFLFSILLRTHTSLYTKHNYVVIFHGCGYRAVVLCKQQINNINNNFNNDDKNNRHFSP